MKVRCSLEEGLSDVATDAASELIAVLTGRARAIGIASTSFDHGLSVNATLELIAVLSSGASTIGIAGTIGDGAS